LDCQSLPLAKIPVMERAMNGFVRTSLGKAFVLQDHKRLPARFFARLTSTRTSRIG
jgi:hypothetical protein